MKSLKSYIQEKLIIKKSKINMYDMFHNCPIKEKYKPKFK